MRDGHGLGAAAVPLVLALLAGVSACAPARVCAGVGVDSEVSVLFVRKGYGDLEGASYELCTRGRCAKGELPQEAHTRVSVRLPADTGPAAGPVRFRVTRAGEARPVVDASKDVRLTHQSDGCGGGAYSRGLAMTKKDGLTVKIPPGAFAAWLKQRGEQDASPSRTP